MRRIAITGGIAEGKSTVLEYCRALGCTVGSADLLARKVLDLPEVRAELAALPGISESVGRDEIRRAIAKEPAFRRIVNRITHPHILAALRTCPAEVLEVPLLIEACLHGEFARIWVVTCGADEQFRRVVARYGAESAREMLAVQLPTAAKTPFADRIIRTNATEDNVKRYVSAIVKNELGDLRFQ